MAYHENHLQEFVADTSCVGSARYTDSVIIAIAMRARAELRITLERLVHGMHHDRLTDRMTD